MAVGSDRSRPLLWLQTAASNSPSPIPSWALRWLGFSLLPVAWGAWGAWIQWQGLKRGLQAATVGWVPTMLLGQLLLGSYHRGLAARILRAAWRHSCLTPAVLQGAV